MAWRFDWLRSWDEVWEPRHLARWRAACDDPTAHATPFMHPDLVRGWLATMGGPGGFAPFFLHATHADGQQVLWLLVRPRDGLLRRLLPVGDGTGGPHFAYNDPLVVPARSAEEALAPGFWPAFERELRARAGSWFDSVALHRLRREVAGEAVGDPAPLGAPYVRLDAYPDFHAYMAARPSSLQKQIERKLRKAASEGRPELPHARAGRAGRGPRLAARSRGGAVGPLSGDGAGAAAAGEPRGRGDRRRPGALLGVPARRTADELAHRLPARRHALPRLLRHRRGPGAAFAGPSAHLLDASSGTWRRGASPTTS